MTLPHFNDFALKCVIAKTRSPAGPSIQVLPKNCYFRSSRFWSLRWWNISYFWVLKMYQTQQQRCNNRKQYLYNSFTILSLFHYSVSHYKTIYWYIIHNKFVIFSFHKTFKFWQDNNSCTRISFTFPSNSIRQMTWILYRLYEPRRWSFPRTGQSELVPRSLVLGRTFSPLDHSMYQSCTQSLGKQME